MSFLFRDLVSRRRRRRRDHCGVVNAMGPLGSSGWECARGRVGARRLDPLLDPLLTGLRKRYVSN